MAGFGRSRCAPGPVELVKAVRINEGAERHRLLPISQSPEAVGPFIVNSECSQVLPLRALCPGRARIRLSVLPRLQVGPIVVPGLATRINSRSRRFLSDHRCLHRLGA